MQFQLVDFARLTTDSRIDIQSGEDTKLDVAARFDRDDDCYGWNNEAYFSAALWRSPLWKLAKGRYLVKAVVISAGLRWKFRARLVNDVARSDFRLEPLTENELSNF